MKWEDGAVVNFEMVPPDMSFMPAVIPAEGGMDFLVGRMPEGGQSGPGARLRHDTVCATCGKGFAKGDIVDVRLAEEWDDAAFAHRMCGLPTPPPIPPSHRYRGFGFSMKAPEPGQVQAKLRAFSLNDDE